MKDFTLSEKSKDRLLNIALAGSLALLIGGFIQHEPVKKGSLPIRNSYSTSVVQPVKAKDLPAYELVNELPTKQQQPTGKTAQISLTPSNAEQHVSVNAGNTSDKAQVSSSNYRQPKKIQITETLTKVLSTSKLNLL